LIQSTPRVNFSPSQSQRSREGKLGISVVHTTHLSSVEMSICLLIFVHGHSPQKCTRSLPKFVHGHSQSSHTCKVNVTGAPERRAAEGESHINLHASRARRCSVSTLFRAGGRNGRGRTQEYATLRLDCRSSCAEVPRRARICGS